MASKKPLDLVNPFIIDFQKNSGGGCALDTHSAHQITDGDFRDFLIKVRTASSLPKSPVVSIVDSFWNPSWDDYVHSYVYNYSITVNADPKASYLKLNILEESKDCYLHILIKRLKVALTTIIEQKLAKNILCVYEYGAVTDSHTDYKKPHFHLLVYCTRINKLKAVLEDIFETSLKDYYICGGRYKRGPINRIRPKARNPKYDKRSDEDKRLEVRNAIDYLAFTYFKKESDKIGNNLLFNYLTKT